MADEDMIDALKGNLVLHELHLCSFATIDQEVTVLNRQVL